MCTLVMMCVSSIANAQSDTTQVTYFTLEEHEITLKVGESHQLRVNPADAEVLWMESFALTDNPVAIIDAKGLVTALKTGSTVVGVETKGGFIMEYCRVNVIDEGGVRKDKKAFKPVDECQWEDVHFSLTNDGVFTAEGTYYGSGAQTNYLNYIVTDQCIFLWFEINYEDSTRMFYPQPFSLEIKDCNAQEYNIYLNNRNQLVQTNGGFVKYAIRRGGDSQKQISFADEDNLYIYTTSYGPGSIYNQGPVGQVMLSVVSDQIIIKKKSEVSQEKIENTVLRRIPAAQISWINNDVCSVISDEQSIDSNLSTLLADDDMISVRPAYIRKIYKDLMELYPVRQVAVYGFTDEIYVTQEYDNDDEVDTFIASLGVQVETTSGDSFGGVRKHHIYVPKESDIISIANSLYETGYFSISSPKQIKSVRETNTEPLDVTGLDYIFNSEGKKSYMYLLPGLFMVTKDRETDKAVIEALLNKYLTDPYYEWIGDTRCQVKTDESLVEEAIAKLRNEEPVNSANRSYLKKSDYEYNLVNGTDYPNIFNFSQELLVSFKDDVSDSVKDSLRNALNLTFLEESYVTKWLAPKTADVIKISNSIYESGYVEWVELDWQTGYNIIFWSSSGSGTTDIKRHESPVAGEIVSESYYDLLGRRMDSPSGLTIVVTRFSDGSTRTEKLLFGK